MSLVQSDTAKEVSRALFVLGGFVALGLLARRPSTKQTRIAAPIPKAPSQNVGTADGRASIREMYENDNDDNDSFEVFVAPPDRFKFNAAHFIAYKGFRERLHGHNYSVSVTLRGRGRLGHDGYLVDFGDVKQVVSALCKNLNEHFLMPMQSDAIDIKVEGGKCYLTCEDGAEFVIPESDVAKLQIIHSSAEEIARFLWVQIVEAFGKEELESRNVTSLQVAVAEMPNQQATFRRDLSDADKPFLAHSRHTTPKPCFGAKD